MLCEQKLIFGRSTFPQHLPDKCFLFGGWSLWQAIQRYLPAGTVDDKAFKSRVVNPEIPTGTSSQKKLDSEFCSMKPKRCFFHSDPGTKHITLRYLL